MKKIKIIVVSVLFCAIGYAGYAVYERVTTSETERFILNNIEALTMNEPGGGLDFLYVRREGTCILPGELKGKIEAAGFTIIRVLSNGNLEISGLVDCILGGYETCIPVGCSEIHQLLLK